MSDMSVFGLSYRLHLQGGAQDSALSEGLSDTVNLPSPAGSLPHRHHTQLYTAVLEVQTAADSSAAPQPVDLVGVTPSTGPSSALHNNDNPTEASHTQAAALQTEAGPSRPAAGTASPAVVHSRKRCCSTSKLGDIDQQELRRSAVVC